jgi:hypothetical protein
VISRGQFFSAPADVLGGEKSTVLLLFKPLLIRNGQRRCVHAKLLENEISFKSKRRGGFVLRSPRVADEFMPSSSSEAKKPAKKLSLKKKATATASQAVVLSQAPTSQVDCLLDDDIAAPAPGSAKR